MIEPAATTPQAVAQSMLYDGDVTWSIGTHGSCTFAPSCLDSSPELAASDSGNVILTQNAALQFAIPSAALVIAYEQLGLGPHSWTQSIAFCLADRAAALSSRTVLTELGPDTRAVRPDDRAGVLFDLGIGAPHVEVCVRSDDPTLTRILRRGAGRNLFTAAAEQLAAIEAAEPHQIFRSAAARIEVFQPDDPSGSDRRAALFGEWPHPLPSPIAGQRRQTDDAPIPPGWTPVLTAHPRSPVAGGHPLPLDGGFDASRYAAFQRLLERFAPAGYMEEKLLINWAVISGLEPQLFPRPEDVSIRQAARIALRQMVHARPHTPNLNDWLSAFDIDE